MPTPSVINSRIASFIASHDLIARALKKLQAIIDLKLAFVLVVCVCGGFDACTSVAFRTEANTFTSAYGDVLNEQMLLNLARLDNGHPAYFIAVGTLNSKWTMGASATGGASPSDTDALTRGHTLGAPTPGGLLGLTTKTLSDVKTIFLGGNASATVAASVAPEFQLIPLNNEQLSQQVLNPTRKDIFFALYDQGYPVDLLMRVLVEEIQIKLPSVNLVLRNDPSGILRKDLTNLNESDYRSYVGFLTICQMARNLQRAGLLKVETTETAFAAETGSGISDEPDPWTVLETKKAGAQWNKTEKGKWELGSAGSTKKVFKINSAVKQFQGAIVTPNSVITRGLDPKDADTYVVNAMLAVLGGKGLAVGGSESGGREKPKEDSESSSPTPATAQSSPATDSTSNKSATQQTASKEKAKTAAEKGPYAKLILRSYARVLHAVAREQNVFPQNYAWLPIPNAQNDPVLRTKWDGLSEKPGHRIGAVLYANTNYIAADPKNPPQGRSETWNRDVFRLLVALNSQVAVDISKFQRQVLEVR